MGTSQPVYCGKESFIQSYCPVCCVWHKFISLLMKRSPEMTRTILFFTIYKWLTQNFLCFQFFGKPFNGFLFIYILLTAVCTFHLVCSRCYLATSLPPPLLIFRLRNLSRIAFQHLYLHFIEIHYSLHTLTGFYFVWCPALYQWVLPTSTAVRVFLIIFLLSVLLRKPRKTLFWAPEWLLQQPSRTKVLEAN